MPWRPTCDAKAARLMWPAPSFPNMERVVLNSGSRPAEPANIEARIKAV